MAELTILKRETIKQNKSVVEIIIAKFATTETSGSVTLSGNLRSIAAHSFGAIGPETLYLNESSHLASDGTIQVASSHLAVVRSAGTTSGLKFHLRLEGP